MAPSAAQKRKNPLYYLPPNAVEAIATLLVYQGSAADPDNTKPHSNKSWLANQHSQVTSLSPDLKLNRPQLSLATFFDILIPTSTYGGGVCGCLCKSAHDALDPDLIFWCFSQLSNEVGHHTDKYRRWARKYPAQSRAELEDYMNRMTGVATLYHTTTEMEELFLGGRGTYKTLPKKFWLNRVRNHCSACVLAVVGGRAQMLIDLRASMLARKKDRRAPRMMRLVEAWIDGFPVGFPLEMRRESEQMARELVKFSLRVVEARKEEEIRDARGGREPGYYEERGERGKTGKTGITGFVNRKWGELKENFKDEVEKRSGSRPGSRDGSRPPSSSGRSHRESSSRPGSSSGHRSSSRGRDETPRHTTSSRPGSSSGSYHDYDYDRDDRRDHSRPASARSSSGVSNRSSTTSIHPDIRSDYEAYLPAYAESVAPDDDNDDRRYSTSSSRSNRDSTPSRRDSTPSATTLRPDRSSYSSSIYSTDEDGLHPSDPGFRGSSAPYNVNVSREERRRTVMANMGLTSSDVPLDADEEGYYPSDDDDDEVDAEGQYVPARANWMNGLESSKCPVCERDIGGMSMAERARHANECLDGKIAGLAAGSEAEVEGWRGARESRPYRMSAASSTASSNGRGSEYAGASQYGEEYGEEEWNDGESEYGIGRSVSNRVGTGNRTAEVAGEIDRRSTVGGRFRNVVRTK
ncbi:hypothetical protein GE09DRAFT_488361 [Coniochaeta sp. 2T2.1]|nr:hypothetical protein GE09DRAFT_488361 [Coniochaeta sp. 2T2.1]